MRTHALIICSLAVAAACTYERSLGKQAPTDAANTDDAAEFDAAAPADAALWAWEGSTPIADLTYAVTSRFVEHGPRLYWLGGGSLNSIAKTGGPIDILAAPSGGALAGDAAGLAYTTINGTIVAQPWAGPPVILATPGRHYIDVAVDPTHVFALADDRLDRFPRAGGAATTLLAAPTPCRLFAPLVIDDAFVYVKGLTADSPSCPSQSATTNWYFARVPLTGGPPANTPLEADDLLAAGGERVFGTRAIPVTSSRLGGPTEPLYASIWGSISVHNLVVGNTAAYWSAHHQPTTPPMSELACRPLNGNPPSVLSRGRGVVHALIADADALYAIISLEPQTPSHVLRLRRLPRCPGG